MQDNWLPMPRYKLRKNLVRSVLQREALPGKTCLELGYGAGDMLLMYAELGLTAYGYDISEEAYQVAARRISGRPPLNTKIVLLHNEEEIRAKRYDYLMAFEVLEHMEDDASVLQQWRDLLKDGGKLLISVPAHKSKWGADDVAFGHYRRYEREEMSALLTNSGFQILHFWNYAYPLSLLLDLYPNRRVLSGSGKSLSRTERSKLSGVKRKRNLTNRVFSSDSFLYPFFLLQRLFLNRDISSSYLIIAGKVPWIGRP